MIWGAIKGMLAGAWGYIAAAGAAILAVLIVLFQAKKAGQNEVKAAVAEKEIENVTKARKVEQEVARTKSADVQRELRDKYSRD